MIIQYFESDYIDERQFWRADDNILGFCFTLSGFRRIEKDFENIKKEILEKNKCIKSILEPLKVTLYFDEDKGLWMREEPSDFEWWKYKKQGMIRDFKICYLDIEEGYKLLLKDEEED